MSLDARGHLQAGIDELERQAALGRFNPMCIRALANAAAVLGQRDVADRAVHLLRAAPDEAFWAGAIANFELPKVVPEGLRTLDPPEKLEQRHPRYCEETMVGRVRSFAKTEEHFAHCLAGRTPEARNMAASGLQLEEVGATLAVLGDFDSALSVARDPELEPFRQRGVLFVVVIELFRRDRVFEADTLLAEIGSVNLGVWDRVQLALGLAGREPWGGYPYPDW